MFDHISPRRRANNFSVNRTANGVSCTMPPPYLALSATDALELAAWLVVAADPNDDRFSAILEDIKAARPPPEPVLPSGPTVVEDRVLKQKSRPLIKT